MTDSLFYNPFLRIKEDTLKKLMGAGKPYVVIQRFQWPGQPCKKPFCCRLMLMNRRLVTMNWS
jgi:hypothetical protein